MYDEELEDKLINYILEQKKYNKKPIKFLIFKKKLYKSNKIKYHSSIHTKTTYSKKTEIHFYKLNI